ncbi:MAG: FABP family protein [bacterium]|nr:FABP family protein [bacterium]MXZ31244.1 FABP family protein [Acidimicrobiia bacterium]MYE66678.1 FABP family protein [Acidimicrobiia bacterium]
MDPHPAVAHLAPLVGTWRGGGRGDYPTIEPFEYREEVTIGHVGKPFLAYSQRTKGADGSPLHAESGYLRPAGERGLEALIVHPSGISELLLGEATETHFGLLLTLRAGTDDAAGDAGDAGDPAASAMNRCGPGGRVILTPTAKRVDAIERRVSVDGDTMRYEVHMAAVGELMTPHLEATLHRAD